MDEIDKKQQELIDQAYSEINRLKDEIDNIRGKEPEIQKPFKDAIVENIDYEIALIIKCKKPNTQNLNRILELREAKITALQLIKEGVLDVKEVDIDG